MEFFDGEDTQGAFMFEVMKDSLHEIVDKWKILPLGSLGTTDNGLSKPRGAIAGHLLAADLKNGTISNDTNHTAA